MDFKRVLTWPEYLAYEAKHGDVGSAILAEMPDGKIKVIPYKVWYDLFH